MRFGGRGAGPSSIKSAVRFGKVSLSRVCHPHPSGVGIPIPVFFSAEACRPHGGTALRGGALAVPSMFAEEKDRMLGRHVYRVHRSDDGWSVTKEGESGPRAGFAGRDEALAQACRLAEADEPSRVIVDDGDGALLEERLFGADLSQELGA